MCLLQKDQLKTGEINAWLKLEKLKIKGKNNTNKRNFKIYSKFI